MTEPPASSTTESPRARRIVVLGGGVCGLAVALRMLEHEAGADVVILEREDRVGGLARRLTLGDQVADMGPHRIHTELPDVQAFLQDLAGREMVRVPRQSQMWLDGRWVEYPPKPMEMLRAWGPMRLAKAAASFAAGKLRRAGAGQADSFEKVMTEAFGAELYKLIVLGYTEKVWKTAPSQIHGDIARVRVSAGGLDRIVKRVLVGEKEGQETALKKFYYIPGGVERLAEKLRERVLALGGRIETGQEVRDLERRGNGVWRVEASGATHEADFVFSTLPVTDLLEWLLMRRPDSEVATARGGMRFIANFLVCLLVKKDRVTPNQWLYFPGPDTIFNRGYEPKNFHESMGAAGQSLLMLETTCLHGDATWGMSDEDLTEASIAGVEATGLLTRADIAETRVVRIPHTYPLYDLGYRERLERVWGYLREWPGLISVGRQGLFLHNNMDHSIHMGFRAAEVAAVEAREAPERAFYDEVERFQAFRIVD
ncbi:MAG: FAD-dependent oxidoreductase [Sumerlaeia bacterium]